MIARNSLFVLALSLSALAFGGCQSHMSSEMESMSGFAGGNGAFGEDTLHPGARAPDRPVPLIKASMQGCGCDSVTPGAPEKAHH